MEVDSVISYATSLANISDISQVGEARRNATELTRLLQFNEVTAGKVAIVITELGTNLIKHGGGGQLLFNPVQTAHENWLEIIALDKGPGMADISACMRDGFSSAGTTGQGLGAVARQSDVFEIVSAHDKGTAALACVYAKKPVTQKPGLRFGAVNLPKLGENVSGDTWAARLDGSGATIIMADGLGHGVMAAEASKMAIHSFSSRSENAPCIVLQDVHAAIRSTRGAAAAVLRCDQDKGQVTYCGVGNIATTIIGGEHQSKSLVSTNGIVGYDARRFREFQHPWSEDDLIVMYSDGLKNNWSLEHYPNLIHRHPTLIAAVLYRDFTRGTDDITVVAGKK